MKIKLIVTRKLYRASRKVARYFRELHSEQLYTLAYAEDADKNTKFAALIEYLEVLKCSNR